MISSLLTASVRLMRMLTGTGVIALVGENTYAHTPKSMAYLEGAAVDFFNLWYRQIYNRVIYVLTRCQYQHEILLLQMARVLQDENTRGPP
jgi:hypothetical protein